MCALKSPAETPSRTAVMRRKWLEKFNYAKTQIKGAFLKKLREPKIRPVFKGWGGKSGIRLRCFVSEACPDGAPKEYRIIAGSAFENSETSAKFKTRSGKPRLGTYHIPKEIPRLRGGVGGKRGTLGFDLEGRVSIYVPPQNYGADVGADLVAAAARFGKQLGLKRLYTIVPLTIPGKLKIFSESNWSKYHEDSACAKYELKL